MIVFHLFAMYVYGSSWGITCILILNIKGFFMNVQAISSGHYTFT